MSDDRKLPKDQQSELDKNKSAADKKPTNEDNAELSDNELNGISGGAFQAHISVKGNKQGQNKGENAH